MSWILCSSSGRVSGFWGTSCTKTTVSGGKASSVASKCNVLQYYKSFSWPPVGGCRQTGSIVGVVIDIPGE